jgi:hypothetical protein
VLREKSPEVTAQQHSGEDRASPPMQKTNISADVEGLQEAQGEQVDEEGHAADQQVKGRGQARRPEGAPPRGREAARRIAVALWFPRTQSRKSCRSARRVVPSWLFSESKRTAFVRR